MDIINIRMNWENVRITIKDVLQIVSFVVLGALAFSAQSSKIDAQTSKIDLLTDVIKEIKSDNKENNSKSEVAGQTLINQVNANTLQIKLLEQDMQRLKDRKY
jgi:hypothetical protein